VGINRTLNNFKGFTFGGVSSKTYSVYLTGEAVYNAPEREVEMIAIPGRNGMFALDRGRFENIEVTYHATIAAKNEADFREAISGLRNALCSQVGYARLEDEYNPDEYRMAVYKSGLDVSPTLSRLGEFDIVFDCKPQRFLTSGETKQRVTSGADITNPTLFNSSPLLEAYGYGKINLDNETVEILPSQEIGEIIIAAQVSNISQTLDTARLNTGDAIYIDGVNAVFYIYGNVDEITSVSLTSGANCDATFEGSDAMIYQRVYKSELAFVYGTARTIRKNIDFTVKGERSGTIYEGSGRVQTTIAYDGADTISMSIVNTVWSGAAFSPGPSATHPTEQTIGEATGVSTKPTGGDPTYIDLDIGEAYKIENGVITSLNNYTIIPAELPTLKPGDTEITFDNTITALDISPRWWKI
jgi:phage-related protein